MSIPAEVVRRLGLTAGAELFWVEDGRVGIASMPAGRKTRRILNAHEEAIAEHRDVFRDLAR